MDATNDTVLLSYWGKAGEDRNCHPLAWHSLDVAATAACLLDHHATLRAGLATALGLSEKQLPAWVRLFAALHDLGKFSHRFQNLRRDIAADRLPGSLPDKDYSVRHDQLGQEIWLKSIRPLLRDAWRADGCGWRSKQIENWLDQWAAVATGHHGQPPRQELQLDFEAHFRAQDIAVAEQFTRELLNLFKPGSLHLPQALDAKAARQAIQRASWWLSGLMILADWLGSNRDYFPFYDRAEPFERYWQRACEQAERAIGASGLLPCAPSPSTDFAALFPQLARFAPSPLQQLAAELPLHPGAQLIVCEDVTGAGKTEAALLLVQRLLRKTGANGLYFALPTMATANAMFERASDVYQRLFAGDQCASIVLAHGGRDLNEHFQQLVLPAIRSEENSALPRSEADQVASARCSAWLADGHKRALLAQVGVGTIDQALQAVLPNKHQSLRLLGLFGKVLLVDEVHANDTYMHKLLLVLLKAHARSGGSAILLSATLPAKMRRELFAAYGVTVTAPTSAAYPLLSHAAATGALAEQAVATPARVARRVAVDYVDDSAEVIAALRDAVASGRCACWVRNSVADARESWCELRALLPEAAVELFHARCALGDRLDAENRALAAFGKRADPAQRCGRILIATQVVEQSLDLDFDLMISDLAPIDLLIQRAGRLCRHPRSSDGRLKDGDDERGTPRLLVYGPMPGAEADRRWLSIALPRTAAVYPDHAQLWLTAQTLIERGGWRMPEDARAMIEAVFGESAVEAAPAALAERHRQVIGQSGADSSLAQLNAIKLDLGYRIEGGPDWWADSKTPTRLGEPDISVYLARRDGGRLVPWYAAERHAWALSRLQIPCRHLAAGTQSAEVEVLRPSLPGKGRWCEVLVLEPDGGRWIGEGSDADGKPVLLRYSAVDGIVYPHEAKVIDINDSR